MFVLWGGGGPGFSCSQNAGGFPCWYRWIEPSAAVRYRTAANQWANWKIPNHCHSGGGARSRSSRTFCLRHSCRKETSGNRAQKNLPVQISTPITSYRCPIRCLAGPSTLKRLHSDNLHHSRTDHVAVITT